MGAEARSNDTALERFRSYLRLLAEVQLGGRLRGKVDPSDLVQQTLLEANQDLSAVRGGQSAEVAAWLRRILSHNLADAARHYGRARRDAVRERSLESALDASASRLHEWAAADQSSPSERAVRQESALRLADALMQLPDAQRAALVLQHWQGLTLAEIGRTLDRSPAAVAGLIKRGLKQLRAILHDESV